MDECRYSTMWSSPVLVAVVLIGTVKFGSALDNGLARTPPMSWLSWGRFECETDCVTNPDSCIRHVSEALYKQMTDLMVHNGYLDAGYEYVNIDDCWMANQRDFDGTLQANYSRFPSGIRSLADYIHSKGLKFDFYQDCGTKTCKGYPGSEGYFKKDADTFAKWGVDMLKFDGCYAEPSEMDSIYPEMTKALNKSGRNIAFSCSWPPYQFDKYTPDYGNIARNCNLWHSYNDINDSWQSVQNIMQHYASIQHELIPFVEPGAWNDPDMLMIGNFGLSVDQARTQMAIWAILAAPLFISADLRNIRPEFEDILKNKEVIAVNQDRYGRIGRQVYNSKNIEIWMRPIGPSAADGSMSAAIAIHYSYEMGSARLVNVSLSSLSMNYEGGYVFNDLFEKQIENLKLGPNGYFHVRVNPSGVVMLKATIQE